MPKLRQLSFQDFDQVASDITTLRDGGYEQGGAWNLSQVCEHLANTLSVGLHGGMKPMPWLLRATVYRAIFELVILTGKMPSGAQAPPELTPDEREADDPTAIQRCLDLLVEARDRVDPIPPNPFVTGMHLKKWRKLQYVHCAHHLSFLGSKQAAS